MRPLRFGTILLALLALACGIARFPYGYDVPEQYVAGSPLGGLLGPIGVPIPLDIDLASETAARNTGPAQHVYLVGLSLSVTTTSEPAGDTDDLSFVDAIDIFIEPTASGSTLTRQRVAHLDPAPDGQRTISLTPDAVDLVQYLREGARLTSNARGTVPPDDVSYTGHLDLAIEVL